MIQARSVRTGFLERGCVQQVFNNTLFSKSLPILRKTSDKWLQEMRIRKFVSPKNYFIITRIWQNKGVTIDSVEIQIDASPANKTPAK